MRLSLFAGLMLRHGERTLEIIRELPGHEFQLEDVYTKRPTVLNQAELLKRIYNKTYVVILSEQVTEDNSNSKWPAFADLSSLTARERQELDRRLLYIKALQKNGVTRGQRQKIQSLIRSVAKNSGHEVSPSTSAVMLWMRNYENSGLNPLALVDKHRIRKRSKRLLPEVERVLWKVLKSTYFTRDRYTLKHAHDQLVLALKPVAKALKVDPVDVEVSYPTLQRRVSEVDAFHRIASREGIDRARIVCRTAFPGAAPAYPLQRVEIDHTPLNWVVICDISGLPLGRPTLTIMLDSYSSYVLGFYLSFYGPGLTSVCGVVRNAILPKDELIAGLDLSTPWISHGIGDELALDNGLEFHSFGFKTMAMVLGVDLMYCQVRTPWLKPRVERYFSNFDMFTLSKGRVRKPAANAVQIDPYKNAAITFSALMKGLMMYFVDVHPNEPNWRKMATPYELFSRGIEQSPPATFPGSLEQLKLASGMSKHLTLAQGGIEMYGLPYGSYDFKSIANKYGKKLKLLCKWDPDDISVLYVQPPNSIEYIEAQCKWPHYADGLSFNQHKLIRSTARTTFKEPDKLESLLKARQQLHEHWMDVTRHRGRADALLAGRYADLTSHKVFAQHDAQATEPGSQTPTTAANVIVESDSVWAPQDIPAFSSFTF